MHEIIDQIAADLGASVNNRAQWSSRRSVPPKWILKIIAEARTRRIALVESDFTDFRRPVQRQRAA